MKKILLFSLVTLALMFLIVSCAPQTQQTNEERLTEQMHSSSAIAGMATRPICATAAVTNCRTAAGNIYFTYLGINYVYPTGWCSGVYAYNSRCISPTLYENCMNQCTGSERCNRGVCVAPANQCADADGDGYRNPSNPPGCSLGGLADCNDANRNIHPGAAEICGNGIDEDCSGADLPCAPDPETICDNIDNNGNGVVDEGCDDDNDNYCDASMFVDGNPATCTYDGRRPRGRERGRDCNDNDVAISPAAADTTCDGVDQNCDGKDGTANQDYCDGRDDNCDGVVDGSPTVRTTCPECTDQDGGNFPLVGNFGVETWQSLNYPPQETVLYDSCFSATLLNETICLTPGWFGRGSQISSVTVDCSASGRSCIPEAGGARCG